MNEPAQVSATGLIQDEISITDLIMKLWQRRGLIVVLPIVFLLLAVTGLFFSAVKTQSPTVFFVQLQGIHKSTYPNGVRFSPQDLLIPEVLERAVSQLKLPLDDDLREAIQVEYGVPTTVGIQRKYQKKLADKKLTAVDIETINAAYQAELQQVSESGLRITIDHAALGLSAEQGAVLANALPRAWTEVFTQKYRVVLDPSLNNVSLPNNDNHLKSTSDILSARRVLKRIGRGLSVVSSDNRLKAIVSKGGFNSADLQSELQIFNELFFRTIFTGLFVHPDAVANTFKAEIGLQIEGIDRRIQELDRSLADLKGFRGQAPKTQATNGTGETVQFGDSTLKQVVDLANQASLSDYLRQVLTARRQLVDQKSELQIEMSRSSGKFIPEKTEDFLTAATLSYSNLKEEYVSLLTSARKIRQQAYGDFYRPLGAPDVVGSLLPSKSKLILALSLLLGGMLAIMLALVLPPRSKLSSADSPSKIK